MKFPTKNTCAYAIFETIHSGGNKTKGQLIRHLSSRFARQTATDKINELVVNGQLVPVGEELGISVLVRRHLDQCEIDAMPPMPAAPENVATPRIVKPFRPLTGYKLNRDGMRPGAGDYRAWPSRHLP